MIEIVFNDSIGGGIQMAQRLDADSKVASMTVFAGDGAEELNGHGEPVAAEPYNGPVMKKRNGKIVVAQMEADIGDLSQLETRIEVYEQLYGIFEELKELAAFTEVRDYAVARIRQAAESGEAVRIWWSDAPGEVCGFYWVMSLLKDHPGEITAVRTGTEPMLCANPENFPEWEYNEKVVEARERELCAVVWEQLKAENSGLRAVKDSVPFSVNDDFYDEYIKAEMPDGEFSIGSLIGNILAKAEFCANPAWLITRIIAMTDNGELVRVKEDGMIYEHIFIASGCDV